MALDEFYGNTHRAALGGALRICLRLMNVLLLNSGSSTLKYQLIAIAPGRITQKEENTPLPRADRFEKGRLR
jgi:hypothetical protein